MTELPKPDCYDATEDVLAYLLTQMRDYGRAEYLRAIEQLEKMDWVEIMREGQLVTWGDAATLGYRVVETCRALKEQQT